MKEGSFRTQVFSEFARISKALASPARLELVYLLAQGEKSVEQLAQASGLSIANASQHLQTLKSARLAEARREGQRIWYRLASAQVEALWVALQHLGEERLPEVRELGGNHHGLRDSPEPMSAAELARRLKRGDVVALDVRPEDEYAAAHLPGALSIPLDQLPRRMGEIPRDREVVAYCRGPYCLLSLEAVALLRAHGYQALRLAEGLPEWRVGGWDTTFRDTRQPIQAKAVATRTSPRNKGPVLRQDKLSQSRETGP